MLWTRALRTLFKNPLYLIMTLLPVLLSVLLLFPTLQGLTGALDTLMEAVSQPQFFEGYGYYDPMELEAIGNDFIMALLPLLGNLLILLAVSLLNTLLLLPISLQYLGDATRLGYVPAGFAGRGLKRLWWKPFVFSLIISTAANTISSVMSTPLSLDISGFVYLYEDPTPLIVLFSIAVCIYLLISLYLSLTSAMYYGSIAMEDGSFGYSLGRGFVRTFKRFFPLVGANLVMGLVGMVVMAAVVGFYIFNSMDMYSALAAAGSFEVIMGYLHQIINDFCLLLCAGAVIAWFVGCFSMSYAFQQTRYRMEVEAKAAAARQQAQMQYAAAQNVYQMPAAEQPVYEQPAAEQPVYEQPIVEQSSYEQYVNEQIVYAAPAAEPAANESTFTPSEPETIPFASPIPEAQPVQYEQPVEPEQDTETAPFEGNSDQ